MDAKRTEMEKLMGFAPGELESTAAAYESGEWPQGRTVRLGRPPIAGEPTKVVSGRVVESVAEAFEAKAKRHGQTRAERVRELVTLDAMMT
jgi:hypothetical protein